MGYEELDAVELVDLYTLYYVFGSDTTIFPNRAGHLVRVLKRCSYSDWSSPNCKTITRQIFGYIDKCNIQLENGDTMVEWKFQQIRNSHNMQATPRL